MNFDLKNVNLSFLKVEEFSQNVSVLFSQNILLEMYLFTIIVLKDTIGVLELQCISHVRLDTVMTFFVFIVVTFLLSYDFSS